MIALVVGMVLLGWFVLRVYREPRRLGNSVLLLIALGVTLIGVLHVDPDSGLATLALLVIILSPLLVLLLAALLMVNGVQMVRREGRRVANLLSFGLGVALLAPYVLFVVALVVKSPWAAGVLASITLVESYFGFLLLAFLLYSLIYLRLPYRPGMGAIVVHGSGLIGDRVPPLLAARLDRALAILRAEIAAGRAPMLVTSGGKGSDEMVAEADAMADYLLAQGAPAGAILREDRSETTDENLSETRTLLARYGIPTPVVLVTSNFHALRTGILARRQGLDATVVGSRTAFYYLPSAILREFTALLVQHKWTNLVISLALAALPLLAVATYSVE
ncbi:YdcF family protein [Nocardia sp. JMUB6875]|uniref:YdcF family protein n=1 Tax=Nocardia sp. JMUB6875 TaxID=3158170 RepID=UPI0032E707A4